MFGFDPEGGAGDNLVLEALILVFETEIFAVEAATLLFEGDLDVCSFGPADDTRSLELALGICVGDDEEFLSDKPVLEPMFAREARLDGEITTLDEAGRDGDDGDCGESANCVVAESISSIAAFETDELPLVNILDCVLGMSAAGIASIA